MLAENRLIRQAWTGTDSSGRETACLLAALSPEVGRAESAEACPAEIMPAWFAHLTPWIDDAGSEAAWPAMVRRYASLTGRWDVLSAEGWRRLDYTVRRFALDEADQHYNRENYPAVAAAIDTVRALCRRAESGDYPAAAEWAAAKAAAWAAEAAAAEAAAWTAARAAWAAADAGAARAAAAAMAMALRAARTATQAAKVWTAARGVSKEVRKTIAAEAAAEAAAAADRLTCKILDTIEVAIAEAEEGNQI